MDQLYKRPRHELEKILTFIGIEIKIDELITKSQAIPTLLSSYIHPTSSIPTEVYQAGIHTLKHELDITKGFRDWPCQSFSKSYHKSMPIEPRVLATNCSAPFVKCTVKYDLDGG